MNFRGHLIGGSVAAALVTGGCISQNMPFTATICTAGATWVGAQFPDLDINSTPRKWFGRFGAIFLCVCLWGAILESQLQGLLIPALFVGLLSLLLQSGWVKHRGVTHKYWFLLLLNYHFIVPFLPNLIFPFIPDFTGTVIPFLLTGFSLGMLVHFLLDSIYPWQISAWI